MPFNGYKILDFHTHFPTLKADLRKIAQEREYVEKFGQEKLDYLKKMEWDATSARWKKNNMAFPSYDQLNDEEVMRLWEEDRKAKDIDQIVFVTGGGNRHLATLIEDYPAFLGFAHHHPEEPDAAGRLRTAVEEYGLAGYKILAPNVKRPINDPAFFPIWEVAEELKIPILIHFGILGGGAGVVGKQNCNPFVLEDVAKGFPFLNFVLPHFGAGYMAELLLLGWGSKNIYVDLSGSNQWIKWMPFATSKRDVLARFIDSFGIDRLVYGTDSSFLPRGYVMPYLEEWMEISESLKLNNEEISKLFSGNAARLLEAHF